ncbi:dihydrofolate reductase family protein [Roseicyclus mahoneyensis]|jgi:dihydrofolate reductase|nr:dihydrofolate reductase family protein [Roseicyclus mahoneyensis]
MTKKAAMTRSCVLSMVVSVDGFINGAGGEFIAPDWSADLDAWTAGHAARFDTMLFGRAAWESLAAYWPAAETDPATPPAARDLARFMNGTRKIVFSRTLESAERWANSDIADADVATVLAREKAKPGKDMVIFAGARFAQTALAAGVVDELSLLVIPDLFGHGTRLFEGHALRRKLELVESRPMDTGALLTRYNVREPNGQ